MTCGEEGYAPEAEHQIEVEGDPAAQRVRDGLDRVQLYGRVRVRFRVRLGLGLGRARWAVARAPSVASV